MKRNGRHERGREGGFLRAKKSNHFLLFAREEEKTLGDLGRKRRKGRTAVLRGLIKHVQ